MPDPEIPVVSVVDLGLVHAVELDGERLRVELLPTFVGCPALELIRESVADRLAGMAPEVEVEMTFAVPWTSDRITAEGRRKLRESGFAPPGRPPPATAGPVRHHRPAADRRLPVVRVGRHHPGEPVRTHPLPGDRLVQPLPAAVRAVQGRLAVSAT